MMAYADLLPLTTTYPTTYPAMLLGQCSAWALADRLEKLPPQSASAQQEAY